MSFWQNVFGKNILLWGFRSNGERVLYMVLNWELQIDQAIYTLFEVVVDVAVADGSQDFCHWDKN